MRIVGVFSFNGGKEAVERAYPHLLDEVKQIVGKVDAAKCRTKTSKEKTMPGKMLYSPVALNFKFKKLFAARRWKSVRVKCDYPRDCYTAEYHPGNLHKGAFREMDFVKDKLGVEVQFGKYSFMVYNVCAKMTIFSNLEHIKMGIEVVPVKELAKQMSSGVSYFEQIVWDLKQRGIANIDIPVLILGIAV